MPTQRLQFIELCGHKPYIMDIQLIINQISNLFRLLFHKLMQEDPINNGDTYNAADKHTIVFQIF